MLRNKRLKLNIPWRLLAAGATISLVSIEGFAQSGTTSQTIPRTNPKTREYEQQLSHLVATINELQKELAKTKSSRDQLQQSLQNSEQEISELVKKIDSIREALDREKKQLIQLRERKAGLEQSRQQQQRQISQVIRQAYLLGQQSQIKLLLNQEAPYRVSRLLRYNDYIVAAHKIKLDDYLQTLREIREVEIRVLTSTERLVASREQLNLRFQDLKNSQARRLNSLASLNQELTAGGSELSKLRVDQERLERLLEEAARALGNLKLPDGTQPFRKARGQLAFPAQGRVTHGYGSSRLGGKLRWKGLFIKGATGSPVVSIHYGRVIFSDYLRGHGLLLIVDHGDGYMSLYAHNQTLLKETGDWVSSGETIATLGNTGGQSQAGLYFEIRHNGKPQNPRHWLN